MPKRNSDTDIRKLLPDLATILKHADPAYSERIYREAMDNPELDAAVAERDRALAEMDAGAATKESAPVDDVSATLQTAGTPRVSAPSPWAKPGTGDVIDKSALPSASAPKAEAPAVAPPVTSPVRPTRRRRTLPTWVFPGVLAIALSPFAMWAVVSVLPPRHPMKLSPNTPPSAQATAPVTADGGATPSIQSSAPAPNVPTTTSATVPPTVEGAPRIVPSVPAPPDRRHKDPVPRGTGDSPPIKAGSPTPSKTVEAVTPPAPPPPQPPPSKPEAID